MSKESIKALKGKLQAFGDKQKVVQESIKRNEKATKDADVENAKKDLGKELEDAVKVLHELQDAMVLVVDETEGKSGSPSPSPAQDAKPEEKGKKKNYYFTQMSPDEQEISYELKSKYMENVNSQNNRLRTEIMLQGRMGDLVLLNQRNRQLQEECQLSRTNAFKLVKMFERKAKRADSKLEALEQELQRSQELARKYQNLYELERQSKSGGAAGGRKQEGKGQEDRKSPQPPRLHRSSSSSISLLGRSTSVGDVVRKNEYLVGENDTLHREVQRLKRDNAELLKKAKDAMQERDHTLHQLGATERSRQDLLKRYQKERSQHQLLSRSLTRQAADWVESKRQQQQMEEEGRLSTIGPVSPHDAEKRTYAHSVTANVYQPRKMYPVENYAQANKVA